MGHAVYSVSDPRADIFKKFVKQLATEKGCEKEYALYEMVEHMAPEVIGEKRRIYKGVNAMSISTVVWYMECLGFQKRFIHRFLRQHVS